MATIFVGGHLLRAFASPWLPNWYGHHFLIKSNDWVPDDPGDLIIRSGPQFEIPSFGGAVVLQNNIAYGSSVDYPTSPSWADLENPSQYWGYERVNISEDAVDFVWNTLVDLASQIAAAVKLIKADVSPAEAARQLGLGRSTVYREMRRLGITRPA